MRRMLLTVAIAILAIGCILTSTAETAKQDIYERKIEYAMSEADVFMMSLTDTMKEELVRSVISERDEELLAKMLWGEDRENPMYMRAAIIWCVYNRMEAGNTPISEMINHDIFPGYFEEAPVKQWAIDIIRDVTIRYVLELNGFKDVGRVLPKEYLWYEQLPGHRHHTFKTTLKIADPNCVIWDWSLPSPYDN